MPRARKKVQTTWTKRSEEGKTNFLLIGSHEVSVVEVTFKTILKKQNIAAEE